MGTIARQPNATSRIAFDQWKRESSAWQIGGTTHRPIELMALVAPNAFARRSGATMRATAGRYHDVIRIEHKGVDPCKQALTSEDDTKRNGARRYSFQWN
jgi:hypothetical protein